MLVGKLLVIVVIEGMRVKKVMAVKVTPADEKNGGVSDDEKDGGMSDDENDGGMNDDEKDGGMSDDEKDVMMVIAPVNLKVVEMTKLRVMVVRVVQREVRELR